MPHENNGRAAFGLLANDLANDTGVTSVAP